MMTLSTSRLEIWRALECRFGTDIRHDGAVGGGLFFGAARRSIVLNMRKHPCFAAYDLRLQPFACDDCTNWNDVIGVIERYLRKNGWTIVPAI